MLKKIYSLSVIFFLLTSCTTAAPPYDTLTVKGQFTQAESQFLSDRIKKGLQKAAQSLKNLPNVHFTEVSPQNYHVTCVTVKSTLPQTQLKQSDITVFEKTSRRHLYLKHGYKGTFYGLFAFVHGKDAAGKPIHETYKDPDAFKRILKGQDKVFNKPGAIITHVHFAARYGRDVPKGVVQSRILSNDINSFLAQLKKREKKDKLKYIYEGLGPFQAHVTVGVLKSFQGGTAQIKPPLSPTLIHKAYRDIYHSFENWKTHQKKTSKKVFELKHFELSGEKSQPKRQITKIKTL